MIRRIVTLFTAMRLKPGTAGEGPPRRLMRAAKPAFKLSSSSASSSVAWTVFVPIQRRCEPFHLERRDADAHEHRRLRQSGCRIPSRAGKPRRTTHERSETVLEIGPTVLVSRRLQETAG